MRQRLRSLRPPRLLPLGLALLGCGLLAACGGYEAGPTGGGAAVDGGTMPRELPAPESIFDARPARVLVPSTYDARTPLPAVLLLGGYDYHSADLDDWIGVSRLVDALGFVLVMPDGLTDSQGSPYWNATETCCDFDGTGVDDVGYLQAVIDELLRRVAVDPARIGVVGHSAGGFMAFRMACENAPLAGIVSLAGSTFRDEALCHARSGVSVLQVHGLADDVMPFEGDSDAPGALELLRRWALRARCDARGLQDDTTKRDYVADHRTDETTVRRMTGCQAPFDLQLWQLTGADHYPEYRPLFTQDALTWLLSRRRP